MNNPIKTVDESCTVEERMTENAVENILPARYLLKNEDGEFVEDVAGLFERVANNVAEPEDDQEFWSQRFYDEMTELRFVPNSPTLMNAGTEMNQLSACFVLEPKDDMEDIFQTAKQAALVFQSGGGVGYSFSSLRPKGAYINSTGGEASGPVSFMRIFDETCNQVKQGGKRRGAQMGILRVDHPDVLRFATCKRNEGEFSNFNISVAYTDEFIEAVENNEEYTLYDPESDYEKPYTVTQETKKYYEYQYKNNPKDAFDDGEGEIVDENIWRDFEGQILTTSSETLESKWADRIRLEVGDALTLPAEFVWDVMIDGAWQNGEPGLFYLDETNREHSFDVNKYPKHKINATNPCAEQPLSEYEACNLGHINLSLVLRGDAEKYEGSYQSVEEYCEEVIDYANLDHTIETGVRFLDNVVTQSKFPIEEIEERVSGQRKIGLGIMGFAQMLYQMGIPYGSEESYEVAKYIMKYIDRTATMCSHELAKERGSFEYWEESKFADPLEYRDWFERHTGKDASNYQTGYELRNHNVTTIAPTGTTSMIGNTSGGCEPVFNVANFKNVGNDIQGDDMLVEFDDYFLQVLEANSLPVEKVKQEAEDLMRSNEFDGVDDLSIPEEIKEIFVTTGDLSSKQHGLMQRAFQEYCDSGISKTVNLPNQASREDVEDVYKLAVKEDELGAPIKGLTVYRDGSREEQVLTTRVENELDNKCPECGEGEIEETDDCAVCPECFYSPCN